MANSGTFIERIEKQHLSISYRWKSYGQANNEYHKKGNILTINLTAWLNYYLLAHRGYTFDYTNYRIRAKSSCISGNEQW